MKLLDGSELAGFIKEQQAHQVRNLRQAHGVVPRLTITPDNESNDFIQLCQDYSQDILVEVDTATNPGQTAQLALAKATAVNWLLAGYNVDLVGKVILLAGQQSSFDDFIKNWETAGCQILQTEDQTATEQPVDVLIAPSINTSQPANPKAVAIETGSESFTQLLVCALFENAIRSARQQAGS